jgi:PAS domain S-box-containing protein
MSALNQDTKDMETPLNILILEDRPADAELMVYELRKAGYNPSWQRVETEDDFRQQLDPALDIILVDYNLSQFAGLQALDILAETDLGIPVIFVTGTTEEAALECMQRGAVDYLLKDRLGRLGPAVIKALEERRTRDDREFAIEALRASEQRYRGVAETALTGIAIVDPEERFTYTNPSFSEMLGYSPKELLGISLSQIVEPEEFTTIRTQTGHRKKGMRTQYETIVKRKDGASRAVIISSTPLTSKDGEYEGAQAVITDITERKRAEELIQRQIERLEALRQIDLAITSEMDSERTLEIFLKNLVEQLEVDAANVLLYHPETDKLECASRLGFRTDALLFTSLSLGDGYAGKVARDRQAITLPDLKNEPGNFTVSPDLIQEGFTFYYCTPLIAHGEVQGVIELFHRSPKEPDEEWVNFLEMLATHAAIAIVNTSMYSQQAEHSAALEIAVENATEELHQSLDRLEAILNNSPDAILLLTNDGRIEQANQAVEVLLGYSPDELDGAAVGTLLDPAVDFDSGAELAQLAMSARPARSEISAIRKDGSSFDAEVILTLIEHDVVPTAFVCTIRDVTAWKELQRMKDAFVFNVSHELRTPITSMRLNYALFKRDPDEYKYLDSFDREITRLNQMIGDLQRLSLLDQGRVELNMEPVDLNNLLAEAVRDRVVLAESHELELVFSSTEAHIPSVQADANLLGQVLSVLLTNAIKYTPAGGHIEVCAAHEERDGASWAGFHVQDDGLGISSDDLPHITRRFYRGAVGRETGSPGTGLGLSIASEIVKHHRGHIDVESAGIPGEGTTFTVWLPAANDNTRSEKRG